MLVEDSTLVRDLRFMIHDNAAEVEESEGEVEERVEVEEEAAAAAAAAPVAKEKDEEEKCLKLLPEKSSQIESSKITAVNEIEE